MGSAGMKIGEVGIDGGGLRGLPVSGQYSKNVASHSTEFADKPKPCVSQHWILRNDFPARLRDESAGSKV